MPLRFPRLRINRLWLSLGAALVLGLLAAFLSTSYLKNREQRIAAELAQKAKGGPTVAVAVPTKDLTKGTSLDERSVAAREVAADLLYDDVVTADQFDKIAGRRLLKPVLQGRPLRFSDVQDDKAKDLSTALQPGLRALTFDIDEINSFAQMLRPGNFVDLYLIAQDPTAPPPSTQEIRTLIPAVKVLATGQTVKSASDGTPPVIDPLTGQPRAAGTYSNITVEVTPAQAARIALAQQVGRIRALLRNPEDVKDPKFTTLSTAALFREGNSPSVEYIVGGKNSGSGSAAPISINMPNLNIPGMGAPAAAGSSNASLPMGAPSVPNGTR